MTTTAENRPEVAFLRDLYSGICEYTKKELHMLPVPMWDNVRVAAWKTISGTSGAQHDKGLAAQKADIYMNNQLVLGVVLGQTDRETILQFGGLPKSSTAELIMLPALRHLRPIIESSPWRGPYEQVYGKFYLLDDYPDIGLQIACWGNDSKYGGANIRFDRKPLGADDLSACLEIVKRTIVRGQ